jgi:hypothetical protein
MTSVRYLRILCMFYDILPSVADPHHVDADPDPAIHFYANLIQILHFILMRIRILPFNLIRFFFTNDVVES